MSLRTDFQDFLKRGNVVDLAVGVMVGAAFSKIVTAFVNDLVMPLVNPLLPAGEWRKAAWEPVDGMKLLVGDFAGTVLDFLITSFVVFVVLVKFVGFLKRKEAATPPPPNTKSCGECLETIPKLAKRCKFCTSAVAVALLLLFAPAAWAQEPKFAYAKSEETKSTDETKLQAKGGLVVLGGNSRQTTGTLAGMGAIRRGGNRASAEVGVAYARAGVLVSRLAPGDMTIDNAAELGRETTTASRLFSGRARYDRFLTENNAAYGLVHVLSDEPAGKELVSGAQVGYSRQLLANETHRLVAELGYDFSYEKGTAADAVGLQIHSGRAFVAEELKITGSTGAFLSVEALVNLNEEKAPGPGYEAAAAFEDLRMLGKAGLTTTLWRNVSFGFSLTLKYDNAPAPLKAPKGATFGPGFAPLSDELDTLTEATLIVTFL